MKPRWYRIYFNRCEDWPQIWSVDEGDQSSEINVRDFRLKGVEALSGDAVDWKKVDREREPVAWLRVFGVMRVEGGCAYFYKGEQDAE